MANKVPSKNRRLVLNSVKIVSYLHADRVQNQAQQGNGRDSVWDVAYDSWLEGYKYAMREARKTGIKKHG